MHLRPVCASALFVLLTVGSNGGCVGDEPTTSPSAEAGASSSSGAAVVEPDAATSDAGEPRTLGVFLTSTTYAADFARELTDLGDADASAPSPDRAWAFVDNLCRTAARAVPLPNADGYRAMLIIANKSAEVTRFNQLKEAPRATDRWCSVSVTTRVPSCVPETAIIFESPVAIQRGPLHSLIANEYGTAVPSRDRFWSGMYVPPGGALFETQSLTCAGWSSLVSVSDDAGAFEGGVGSVSAVDPSSKSELAWLGADRAPCDTTSLPLLCIEIGVP